MYWCRYVCVYAVELVTYRMPAALTADKAVLGFPRSNQSRSVCPFGVPYIQIKWDNACIHYPI